MKVTSGINVRAQEIVSHGDGVYTLIIETEELEEAKLKIIRELFPNTSERVFELLSIENLLASIVKDYEPPANNHPEPVLKGKRNGKDYQ